MSDVKIASYNVNGIRAATRKGLYSWIEESSPDLICFQEMRSTEQDMPKLLAELNYNKYHEIAQKKGYSGVSIFSTNPANAILNGIGVNWIDDEGRVLTAEYDDFRLVSAYFPSGTAGDLRQDMKMEFLNHFLRFAIDLKRDGKPTIIAGDFNICHLDIDIHNPDKQHKTSGFLPEERAWVTQLLSIGYADAFRKIHPTLKNAYSWWSYRAGSKARNKGWRIDYHMVSDTMIERILEAKIESKWNMSDHAPVTITYRF